jgi:hypothetical protein
MYAGRGFYFVGAHTSTTPERPTSLARSVGIQKIKPPA